MNIFSSLQWYPEKWQETNVRSFSPEEIAAVERAKVVESQYGFSVCFTMRAGGTTFIPLDVNSSLGDGDIVDLTTAKLVTLSKKGEDDIMRVRP